MTPNKSNLLLDVGNNLAEPGTNVHQWTDNGNDAQRWKLDLVKLTNTLGTAKVAESQVKDEALKAISIYPNPVKNTLFFNADLQGTQILIFNNTGSLIVNQVIKENSMDVSNLITGIYLAVFEKDGNKITKQFIKK